MNFITRSAERILSSECHVDFEAKIANPLVGEDTIKNAIQ